MNVAVSSTFQRLTQSKSNEHYTPPWALDLVRELGSIALDPASNPVAQQWIQAETAYMLPVDGMQQSWQCSTGGMWINPPYGTKSKSSLFKCTAFLKWMLIERGRVHGEVWAITAILLSIPNYGASAWIEKAIASYDAKLFPWAVLLVRGDSYGVHLLESRFASCEPGDRIEFVNECGETQGNPPPGCRFWYLGREVKKFAELFREVGAIRVPYFDSVPF